MKNTRIHITDVGPRDGLQNESQIVSVEDKVALINALTNAGINEIEVSSFVSPRWVPQLADAADVFANINRKEDVIYAALVPNEKGLERALECKVDKVSVFTAASETFSQKNTNATIAETIARFESVVDKAHAADLPVRGYVSCIVECPYEGKIKPTQVRNVVQQLLDIGIDEIDLGETIGVAVPNEIETLYETLADFLQPQDSVLHLHDTRGTALTCAAKAIELGVRKFDTSCGGLGGCPYAPGAAGNLATEDFIYFCERMGFEAGVDIDSVIAAGNEVVHRLDKRPASHLAAVCER